MRWFKRKKSLTDEHVLFAIDHALTVLHNCFVEGTEDGTIGRRLWSVGQLSEEEVPLVNAFIGGLYEAMIDGVIKVQEVERAEAGKAREYRALADKLVRDKPSLYLFDSEFIGIEPNEAHEWVKNKLLFPEDDEFRNLGYLIGVEHIEAIIRDPHDRRATSANIPEFKKRLRKRLPREANQGKASSKKKEKGTSWNSANEQKDSEEVTSDTTMGHGVQNHKPEGISLKKAKSISEGNFKFDFNFQSHYMSLDFECISTVPSTFDPEHPKEEGGFLRVHRDSRGRFKISFLLTPYDMISNGKELEGIENITGYGINALFFKLQSQGVGQDFFLLIEPNDISEEGWFYEFEKAPCRSFGKFDPETLPAQTIVEAIVLCDELTVGLARANRTPRAEYQKSKFFGVVSEFTSVRFSRMDKFREVFAKAFGLDTLAGIAEKRGLEISE